MEVRHTLRKWEKDWGYLGFNKEEAAKLFYNSKDKRFSVFIEGIELFDRHVDRWRRIWIGKEPLAQFEVGDILICSKDSSGTYRIRRR